jgi:hypothetical protein
MYLCTNFNKKTGWATFGAIFSQTHLVTLHVDNLFLRQNIRKMDRLPQLVRLNWKEV